MELILIWSKNCVSAGMTTKDAEGNNPVIVALSGETFKIRDTSLCVPVVNLSKESDAKLLEQLKLGFKRTIKWNKYRSQITIQLQNNDLNYLIDPAFTNVNRLFILLFTRIDTGDYRNGYVPGAKTKVFNVLIHGKSFFDLPVKNEEEDYEKIIEMSNNNDYTTGTLLDFAYFKKHYKLIVTDLSK